jgi:hypothetical protein
MLIEDSREKRRVRKQSSKKEKADPLITKKWAQRLLGINFESSKSLFQWRIIRSLLLLISDSSLF